MRRSLEKGYIYNLEVAVHKCSIEKMLWNISQNSKENTSNDVLFKFSFGPTPRCLVPSYLQMPILLISGFFALRKENILANNWDKR